MMNQKSVYTMLVGMAVTAASLMAENALPVKTLYSGSSTANRDSILNKFSSGSFQEVPFSSTNAELGSMTEVNNPTKNGLDAKRTTNQPAASYAGVVRAGYAPAQNPEAATNSAPTDQMKYDFKQGGDAAQAWATMRANGMPYMSVTAWGGAKANSAASWKAALTVPVAGQHLYAYVALPAVVVGGVLEANGPGRFQSRFTAEMQVNGHPVWNSEATRANQLKNSDSSPGKCALGYDYYNQTMFLTQFGDAMNSNASWPVADPSPVKYVVIDLGVFPAGDKVELTFVGRLQAANGSLCCGSAPDYFCTRGEASLVWNDEAAPVKFWFGPAVN